MTTADTTTVRSWARNNGFTTGDRGRLSEAILTAYAKAHTAAPTRPSKTATDTKAVKEVKAGDAVEGVATAAKPKPTRAGKAPGSKPRSTSSAPRTTKAAAANKTLPAKKATAKKVAVKQSAKRPVGAAPAPKSTSAEPMSDTTPAARTGAATTKTGAPARPVARTTKASPRRATPAATSKLVDVAAEVTAERIVALEEQVAALTSRLVAVETTATTSTASTATTSATKPARKFGHRK